MYMYFLFFFLMSHLIIWNLWKLIYFYILNYRLTTLSRNNWKASAAINPEEEPRIELGTLLFLYYAGMEIHRFQMNKFSCIYFFIKYLEISIKTFGLKFWLASKPNSVSEMVSYARIFLIKGYLNHFVQLRTALWQLCVCMNILQWYEYFVWTKIINNFGKFSTIFLIGSISSLVVGNSSLNTSSKLKILLPFWFQKLSY